MNRSLLGITIICAFNACAAYGQAGDYSQSVVTIWTTLGDQRLKQGSGFAIDGGIVTAYHVIFGAQKINVVTAKNETTTDVHVLAFNPNADIAIISARLNSPLPPITLEDRLPKVTEDMLMAGTAHGMPSQIYSVRAVKPELAAIDSLNNTAGKPLLDHPPALQVIELAGIIYGGLSGGPLLVNNGAAIGLLSGSLSEGGSLGWAIPASRVISLKSTSLKFDAPSSVKWEPIPFHSSELNLRTTEYFVRRDVEAAAHVANFLRDSGRLKAVDERLKDELNTGQLTFIPVMTDLEICVEKAYTDLSDMNFCLNDAAGDFPKLKYLLSMLQSLYSERFRLDRGLRSVTNSLQEASRRTDLDEQTRDAIASAVTDVSSNLRDVASTTYELREGIDTATFNTKLDRIQSRASLNFTSRAEAAGLLADIRFTQMVASRYQPFSAFDNWIEDEANYFKSINEIIGRFQPVVVYVPE